MPTQKDHVTINISFKVSADQASGIEQTLAVHADWMRETHSIGPGKSVELVDYYVAKADEFKNPANPEEGTTGKIVITLCETYPNADQLGNHMNQAMSWDGMGDFLKLIQDYDPQIVISGKVVHSL